MGEEADRIIEDILDGGYRNDGEDEPGEARELVCRHCGADTVYWAERAGTWTLYDFTTSRKHACRKADLKRRAEEIIDAFEDLS